MSEEAAEPATKVSARLVELQEIGFLLDETDEAIAIGMELDEDGSDVMAGRWRLHIPKCNIVERRDFDVDKATAKRPRRRKAE